MPRAPTVVEMPGRAMPAAVADRRDGPTGALTRAAATAPRRMMILRAWRPVDAPGTLRGYATIELPIGLIIFDCPVHISHGRPWAALPGRPIIDDTGRHAEDPARPGKRAWAPMGRWLDRDIAERWSARVVELVRGAHPDAFADVEAAP